MSPDTAELYPDPDEHTEFIDDNIDMTGIGTIVHVRKSRGYDKATEFCTRDSQPRRLREPHSSNQLQKRDRFLAPRQIHYMSSITGQPH